MTGTLILNADDYAMTRGISDGILALAEAGRLSSTSAMTTTAHWPEDARRAIKLRGTFAIGLHLNLTFAKPLGKMPKLAPGGEFPDNNAVAGRALRRAIDTVEIGAEIDRQLDRFEEHAGFPPDFVDGHHHVHVLPGIRDALIASLKRRYPAGGMLVRDPADSPATILRRQVAAGKAMAASLLALGFRRRVTDAGFKTNRGFSGYSTFGPVPYAEEFSAALVGQGPRHMIMCHPGFADTELGDRDTIHDRRPQEYAYFAAREDLPAMLWRPSRDAATREYPW